MKTTEPVVKTTLRTPKTGKNGVVCIKVNWNGTRAHESSALAKAADHIRMTELPPSPPEDLF